MSEDQFMGNLYQRFPVTVEKGKGSHVWDVDGKEYIDCMGRLWRCSCRSSKRASCKSN